MRKILYSPGFGAGWTSWNSGDVARYLLTYQPIIDFLEAGGKFTEADCMAYNFVDAGKAAPVLVNKGLPLLLLELMQNCYTKFHKYPYIGGACDLVVKEVKGRVRIQEHDGYESVEEEGEYEGWM